MADVEEVVVGGGEGSTTGFVDEVMAASTSPLAPPNRDPELKAESNGLLMAA